MEWWLGIDWYCTVNLNYPKFLYSINLYMKMINKTMGYSNWPIAPQNQQPVGFWL